MLAAVAAALLVAFVARQARIANPLMPLRLFRSRDVTGSNLVMALLVVGMFGLFFLGALYLQRILGYSPLQVGLAFLPSTIVMGATSLRLSMRFSRARSWSRACVLIVAGLLLFMRMPVDGNYVVDILPATILIGLGAGLSTPALMTLAMSDVQPTTPASPPAWSTRPCRSAARSAWPCSPRWPRERTGASQTPEALLAGYHLAFLIGAAMLGIATLVALYLVRPARSRRAASASAAAAYS